MKILRFIGSFCCFVLMLEGMQALWETHPYWTLILVFGAALYFSDKSEL